jgi:hypothetical protein
MRAVNRRSIVAVIAVGLAVSACSSNEAVTVPTAASPTSAATSEAAPEATTTTLAPANVPTSPAPTTTEAPSVYDGISVPVTVLVSSSVNPTVTRIGPDGVQTVWSIPARASLAAGDGAGGAVAAISGDAPNEFGDVPNVQLVHLLADGSVELIPWNIEADWTLFDVGVVDGRPLALIGVGYVDEPDWEYSPILGVDLETGEARELGVSVAPEYGAGRASIGGDRMAVSAGADLSELISYYNLQGEELEGPSPSDSLPYARGPFMGPAVIEDSGERLAVMQLPESPAFPIDEEATPITVTAEGYEVYPPEGDLVVTIHDVASADELDRIDGPLALQDADFVELDYDGRWVLLTGYVGQDDRLGPFLFDTTAPATGWIELLGIDGPVMLDPPGSGAGGGESPL